MKGRALILLWFYLKIMLPLCYAKRVLYWNVLQTWKNHFVSVNMRPFVLRIYYHSMMRFTILWFMHIFHGAWNRWSKHIKEDSGTRSSLSWSCSLSEKQKWRWTNGRSLSRVPVPLSLKNPTNSWARICRIQPPRKLLWTTCLQNSSR